MSDFEYNKSRLCFEPKIYLVGQTAFNIDQLDEWIEDNDLAKVADTRGTPLSNIWEKASDSSFDKFNSEIMAEFGGRFCYRSWKAGRPTEEYIKNIIESSHNSVLRHVTFNFVIEGVSRSFSHELVRHAAGTAPSQESQRYVDAKDMKFVVPPLYLQLIEDYITTFTPMYNYTEEECHRFRTDMLEAFWNENCSPALEAYTNAQNLYKGYIEKFKGVDEKSLIKKRANEAARAALPNCAETRLLFTLNGDALRHILHMRGDAHADLEIRRFAVALFGKMEKGNGADNLLYDFKESSDQFGPILVK